ncbi:MAG: PorP/SprF family type IX secretion system membrane protein [Saprospiraceae bacterium]|nr:PorP/SprF family type IX secretion system membrane protein [Saprospiraceae bacterium]
MQNWVLPSFFIAIFVLSLQHAWGQDPQFSQYYAAPLHLNPSLTGGFDARYRVSSIYRDQWRGPLEEAINTFGASLDLRFDLQSRALAGDAFGVGIQFVTDQAGSLNLSTNSISLLGAFHKSLGQSNTNYLSAGIQFSTVQRNLLYKNLVFQDQFNGVDSYTGPTGEDLPANNYSFGDFAFGLNYFSAPSSSFSLFAGGVVHHILEPEVSFYRKDDDENQQQLSESSLFRKYSFHGGITTRLSENIDISPRTFVLKQRAHTAITVGNNFIIEPSTTDAFNFHLGAWVRTVQDLEAKFAPDMIGFLAGMGIGNLLIGLSYDVNIRDVVNYPTGQGAFEVSISYFGDYQDEGTICPTF